MLYPSSVVASDGLWAADIVAIQLALNVSSITQLQNGSFAISYNSHTAHVSLYVHQGQSRAEKRPNNCTKHVRLCFVAFYFLDYFNLLHD